MREDVRQGDIEPLYACTNMMDIRATTGDSSSLLRHHRIPGGGVSVGSNKDSLHVIKIGKVALNRPRASMTVTISQIEELFHSTATTVTLEIIE